eukprot:145264_1
MHYLILCILSHLSASDVSFAVVELFFWVCGSLLMMNYIFTYVSGCRLLVFNAFFLVSAVAFGSRGFEYLSYHVSIPPSGDLNRIIISANPSVVTIASAMLLM